MRIRFAPRNWLIGRRQSRNSMGEFMRPERAFVSGTDFELRKIERENFVSSFNPTLFFSSLDRV